MGIKTIEDKVIASWFSVSVLQDLHSFVAVDVSLKYFVCLCLFNSRFFILLFTSCSFVNWSKP